MRRSALADVRNANADAAVEEASAEAAASRAAAVGRGHAAVGARERSLTRDRPRLSGKSHDRNLHLFGSPGTRAGDVYRRSGEVAALPTVGCPAAASGRRFCRRGYASFSTGRCSERKRRCRSRRGKRRGSSFRSRSSRTGSRGRRRARTKLTRDRPRLSGKSHDRNLHLFGSPGTRAGDVYRRSGEVAALPTVGCPAALRALRPQGRNTLEAVDAAR